MAAHSLANGDGLSNWANTFDDGTCCQKQVTSGPDGTASVTIISNAAGTTNITGTIVDDDPTAPGNQAPGRATHIASYDSQRVQVDVSAGAPGLLVLTDAYYPGWQATVNGPVYLVLEVVGVDPLVV